MAGWRRLKALQMRAKESRDSPQARAVTPCEERLAGADLVAYGMEIGRTIDSC